MKNYSGPLNKVWSLLIALGTLFAVLVIQTICSFAAILFIVASKDGAIEELVELVQEPIWLARISLMYALISIVVFGLGYYWVKKYYYKDTPALPVRMSKISYIFGLILFGIAVQAVGNGFLSFANMAFAEAEMFKKYNDMMESLVGVNTTGTMLVYAMLFGPICEELIFRGVILNSLRKGFSDKTAVIISSVLFGVFHMNLIQGVYATIFGIALGYTYLRRRKIIDSIILHITINFIGSIIIGLITAVISSAYGEIAAYTLVSVFGIVFSILWIVLLEDDKNKSKEALQ